MSHPSEETQAPNEAGPYWEAAARGVLLLKRSKRDGRWFHYPRDHSPFGDGGETEWAEASGRGEIYTCSVAYRADPPYCIAYIKLDEGPIMLSNVLHDDLDAVQIGQRVRVCFVDDGTGRKVPMFEPDPG